MENNMPKIEDWEVRTDLNPFINPDMRTRYLIGAVYGHPEFSDGQPIKTPPIMARCGNDVVTLWGQKYILGKPSQRFETKHPNAVQWLLSTLQAAN